MKYLILFFPLFLFADYTMWINQTELTKCHNNEPYVRWVHKPDCPGTCYSDADCKEPYECTIQIDKLKKHSSRDVVSQARKDADKVIKKVSKLADKWDKKKKYQDILSNETLTPEEIQAINDLISALDEITGD